MLTVYGSLEDNGKEEEVGRRNKSIKLEAFNNAVVRDGITYAEAQKLETYADMKRVRAPRTKQSDGRPVYMTVAERIRLRRLNFSGGEQE